MKLKGFYIDLPYDLYRDLRDYAFTKEMKKREVVIHCLRTFFEENSGEVDYEYREDGTKAIILPSKLIKMKETFNVLTDEKEIRGGRLIVPKKGETDK